MKTRRSFGQENNDTLTSSPSVGNLSGKAVRKLPEPNVKNPFREILNWTWMLKVQMVVGFAFVLPIRLILFAISLFMLWVYALVATYGVTRENPYLKPRQRFVTYKIARPTLARLVRMSFGYQWVEVKGERASQSDAPVLVVAPHSTLSDIIAIGADVLSSPVAKAEVMATPVTGTLVKLAEPVLVSRTSKDKTDQVFEAIKERINVARNQVLFFPEGTTTSAEALITFKTGAFQLGLPVQPVLLRFATPWQTWTFIGRSGLVAFLQTLACLHNRLTVEFMPIYHPGAEERADPILYANNVQALMANALDKPVTFHTYDDARLMMKGIQLGLPEDTGLLEYTVARSWTKLDFEDFEELLLRFSRWDEDKDGFLTAEDFIREVEWPVEDDVRKLVAKYDTSRHGKIGYREFVMGYNDLCKELHRDPIFASCVLKELSATTGTLSATSLSAALAASDASSMDSFGCLDDLLRSGAGDSEGVLVTLLQERPELCYLLHVRLME